MADGAGQNDKPCTIDPLSTYFDLQADGFTRPIPVTETFWSDLGSGRLALQGYLLSAFDLASDFPHWEMHPKGDELLICVSGALTVLLEQGGEIIPVPLPPGAICRVPAGTWHFVTAAAPGRLLAITAGEGTEHCSGDASGRTR